MSIASEKVKFASERFLLVRLNPARYIVPTLSAGLYQMTFPFIPSKIERNGIVLTEDQAAPSVNDHWHYDSDSQLLKVKLAAAPDVDDNVLVAYYYLFYTGTVFRSIGEDPESPAANIRNWEPRILKYPSFTESFEDILAGVFSISDTTLSLINHDGHFQQYLSDDDSFYNKEAFIWLCINSVANIQKVFSGTIQGISINQNTVSLRCVDGFNVLNQPALMGDNSDESYFRRDVSSFPDLDPQFHDTPCPYIVGSSSRYKTAAISPGLLEIFDINIGTLAPCTDYNPSVSTSTNRQYGACRLKGTPTTQSFGSIVRTFQTGVGSLGVSFFLAYINDLSNVFIGDTIKWNEAGTDYFGTVKEVGNFTYLTLAYNIIFTDPDPAFILFTLASVIGPQKSFNVFIQFQDDTIIYPKHERDYTLSTSVTSGGNNYVSIQFSTNFEANYPEFGGTALEPNVHRVHFRASNSVVQTHSDILLEILAKCSLSTNTSTFTDAATELPVNCRFHIPNFDEEDYKFYLEYVQDILKSTLGYLKINSSFEVDYFLLSAFSSSDVRDTSITIDGGTNCEIEYADIATTIIAYNPHNDSQQSIDAALRPSETLSSPKARFLHGIVNVNRFRHVLEEISSNIISHIGIKSTRRARYTFETATQDIDTELGQDIRLQNKIVLGGSGTVDLKVMGIEKSPSKIAIKATDLKGI